MARGDQIYVMRPLVGMEGVYEHHGIDCGDGTVIHYRKGDEAMISRTSFEQFAQGKPVFVKDYSASYIPDVVIERAESRLGERQYNLLTNNCEHFATWCKLGKSESAQLASYGLDPARVGTLSRSLATNVAQEEDPIQAMALLSQAMQNLSTTQARLQSQYEQLQHEMNSWDRVARTALNRQREDLARAALERKVALKRQAKNLEQQIAEVQETETSLQRNSQVLKQRITTQEF